MRIEVEISERAYSDLLEFMKKWKLPYSDPPTPEELDVALTFMMGMTRCPKCGNYDLISIINHDSLNPYEWICKDCGRTFGKHEP